MVTKALRSLWAEPRPANAPRRVWRDWVLVAVLVPTAVVEGVLREDVTWRPVVLPLALGVVVALLWRRTHPLLVVLAVFGTVIVADLSTMLVGPLQSIGLYTMAAILLLPYSLLRWGSGREILLGAPIILATLAVSLTADFSGIVDSIVGSLILLFPATLGVSVRYWASSRVRELDQVKLLEREQLARDLHDTVAHHVSGIAIQAQAGRAVATSQPERATEVLAVIEDAASRTLTELRTMVGVLRASEEADFAPRPGVADIERLAGQAEGGPQVDVELSGELDDLSPAVGAALYRLTQESVTNARRHARDATRVAVRVVGDAERVQLTVDDDGAVSTAGGSPSGYGLVGMRERATLLGGTFHAGPSAGGGWRVEAMLPRAGALR